MPNNTQSLVLAGFSAALKLLLSLAQIPWILQIVGTDAVVKGTFLRGMCMLCILRRSGPIDRIGAFALVFLLQLGGQSFAPVGTAEVIDIHSNSNRVPIWTGGALMSIENNNTGRPIIHAFDETGQETLPLSQSRARKPCRSLEFPEGAMERAHWPVGPSIAKAIAKAS